MKKEVSMFADELIESLKAYYLARREMKYAGMTSMDLSDRALASWWDN